MMPPAPTEPPLRGLPAERQDHRVFPGDAALARDGAMPVLAHSGTDHHARVRGRPWARQRPDRRAALPHRDDHNPGAYPMQRRIGAGQLAGLEGSAHIEIAGEVGDTTAPHRLISEYGLG
jgi:hypothetical protein